MINNQNFAKVSYNGQEGYVDNNQLNYAVDHMNELLKGLNEVIDKNQKVQIALETMAGKGTELGRTFEEIARMIDGVTHNDRLSVTLDTCHIHDAGYNLKEDFSSVMTEFDKVIGLDRLKVLHIK